jgi:hypothetical protein
MKKTLLVLILMILSIVSFSQKVGIYNVHDVNIGYINGKNILWDTLRDPCHFNLEIFDSSIIIHSAREQEYKMFQVTKKNNEFTQWYCKDKYDTLCVITFQLANNPKKLDIVYIEYDDLAWYYDYGYYEPYKQKNNFKK